MDDEPFRRHSPDCCCGHPDCTTQEIKATEEAAASATPPDPDRGRVVLQIGHERGLQFRFPDACESWEEWSQLAIEHANAIVDAVLAAEQERQKGK